MPPDASFLFGMQAQKVLASPFGQYAISQLPVNNGLVSFAAATGFDYRTDFQEVLGASDGRGSRPTLVVVRGTFQPNKFLTLAAVTGATITNYNGTQIFIPATGVMSVAFLDASTLAIAPQASLEAASDRFANHVKFRGPLADKAAAASASSDAWFATVTPASQFFTPSGTVPANVLQQVREISAGVRFTDAGMIAAGEFTTVSEQQAQMLLGVLQLIASMAQANKLPNPGAAQAATLLSGAQFSVNGTSLDVTIPVPEQTLEQMYSAKQKPARKASLH